MLTRPVFWLAAQYKMALVSGSSGDAGDKGLPMVRGSLKKITIKFYYVYW